MTKEISKQICEKCGIEPIRLTGCGFVNLKKYGIEEGTDVCIHMDEEDFKCENCECNKIAMELYPDFGQSDNFVKLLELTFEPSQSTIWNLVNIQGRHFSKHKTYCRLTFLALLNVILENNPKMLSDEQNELIKQSIREAEWKYE